MTGINVQQTDVTILKINEDYYILLTDIAKFKSDDPTAVIPAFNTLTSKMDYCQPFAFQQMNVLQEVEKRKLLK